MRRIIAALCYAGLLALAAGAAGRIYDGPLFALLVAGAAVGSVGIGLLLVRRPQWTVAPVSVVAMLAYVVFTVWYSAGASGVSGALPALLGEAVRNGGPQLLTALIPIEAQPDTVLVPVVLVWIAGLICAELGLRVGRAPLALIPPTVLYLAALILAGPHGGVQAWRAVAYVVLSAGALIGTVARSAATDPIGPELTARQRGPMRARLRVRAAAGVAVFVALAAAVVPAVAATVPDTPVDPRAAVTPPQSDTLDQDPLARISGWMQNPTEPLFDATVSTGTRIELAVLTNFDGVTWTIDANYRDAGRELPALSPPPGGAVAPGSVTRITQQITVRDLAGRLVPAVSTPHEIDGIRVAYDTGSGTLLRPNGLLPGTSYSVVSDWAKPNPNLLPMATVPSGPAVSRYLQTGESVPADMQKLADSIEEGNGGAYQRAYALQQFIAEHYTYVTDAPSGHAYPNLEFFLLGPAAQGGQRGTSEQFAASYAVLGRLMGLPTRVVVGFNAPAGHGTVRGKDALAWPEVLFSGVGWVPFDPIPAKDTTHRSLDQDYKPKPDPPTPSDDPSDQATKSPSASASASASRHANGNTGSAALPPWTPYAAGGAVLVLVLVAQLWVVLTRRSRTRARLSQGPPSDRVRGAWLEVLDALRLAGRRTPEHLTATEVADWAVRPPGKGRPLPPLDELVELANLVAFAPEFADDHDAATAATRATSYVRGLRRAQPLRRRLLWSLRPGPLRWSHGSFAAPTAPPPPHPEPLRPATPRR
ncbi:MAG TPA: transglutaminaseTgpA domain-containing protein [Rugosimonospora sp.]